MVTTPELIRLMVADARPVHRLRPPFLRAGAWLACATAVLAVVAASFGLRADLGAKFQETVFVIEIGSSALTAVAAAIAAFHLGLPDRSGRWILLPIPPLMLWLSTVGYGCLVNWVVLDSEGLIYWISVRCLLTIMLGSTPLAVLLVFMLRHARAVRPMATAVIGALAVAGLTASALRIFHELDATIMVLIWTVGVAAVVSVCFALFGRQLLSAAARYGSGHAKLPV